MAATDVWLQAEGGKWELVGRDRYPGAAAEGVNVTANAQGHDTCTFQLKRPEGAEAGDLAAWTPCEILEEDTTIFEGMVRESPISGDDEAFVVQGRGYQYHLDDDAFERAWVHNQLTDWQDARSMPAADLGLFTAAGQVQTGGAPSFGWENQATVPAGSYVGLTLDLGIADAKRVAMEFTTRSAWAGFTVYVRGHDSPSIAGSEVEDAVSFSMTSASPQAGTFATRHRYVTIFLYNSAVQGPVSGDTLVILTAVRVFRDIAYEAANESVLQAPHVLADLLEYLPLLDQSTDEIDPDDTVDFNLPMFRGEGLKSPREYAEGVNALHNYQLGVTVGRKLRFRPPPSVPRYRASSSGAKRFQEQPANSGEGTFNRCVVEGTGPDGQPLRVERRTGQLPEVLGELVSSPGWPNPSFDVDTSGWVPTGGTTITRTTTLGEFDTAPAAGKWGNIQPNTMLDAVATAGDIWRAGTVYRISIRLKGSLRGALGLYALGKVIWETTVPANWGTRRFVWVPPVDVDGADVFIRLYRNSLVTTSPDVFVDSITVETMKPTVLDRRGFTRIHIQQAPTGITTEVGERLADTFLRASMHTPLIGSLPDVGPGDIVDYLTGHPVHPRQLVNAWGELLHLADQIAPDTGAQGRDGTLVGISYSPDEETAALTLDSSRDSYVALLQRLGVAIGGSR